ncbi:CheR family methyltransferase [Bacteriovorax sp. DB6_IX]|uniref:CheR family methyltransferase n=1 Tax=Bacteriovorax sp. DB6_IX TaxID=1353530 RepID=UPI00038A2A01|nr:CheR family methyltransferase [Bacteriovorax sp. DB6_IX]EQC49043.1 protein-glutamate O-methyltransferase CheR [Bacteriovorax sp. DB6_IX]
MSTAPLRAGGYDGLIKRVSAIVAKISGNVLEEKQALMVQTRVKKRMLELGLQTPEEYLSFLERNMEKESGVLVSLLTTHHTFFFREFNHFEYLKTNLAQIVADVRARGENTIKVWSAACSRGQEVYSLAMFFDFYLPKIDPTMKYHIFGSDIDPESVKVAENGVYHRREIKSVPMNYLGEHWARGKGDISDYVKAKKTLTSNVSFRPLNLLDFKTKMRGEKFDIIFCRNVFIYFRPEQIKDIMNDFLHFMHKTSFFFSGISESLGGLDLEITNVGPSIYTHKVEKVVEPVVTDSAAPASITPAARPAAPVAKLPEMPAVLKVLCVDDSSSILTLLKKIFGSDDGFEVVGVAKNGLEAHEMVEKHKPDIVTLDIHMPEMDGVTYLQKHYKKGHPPVVMISSASRDDSDAAMKALRAGASDFIEKPALNNIMERGEEIKTKLKVAYMDRMFETSHVSSIDKEFEQKITIDKAKDKFRAIYCSISDQKKVETFFKELHGEQPPTVMFFEGQDNILEALKGEFSSKLSYKVELMDEMPSSFDANTVYLADFKKLYDDVCTREKSKPTSIVVFGKASTHAGDKMLHWDNAHLLVEDLNYKCELTEVATDVVPATSFAYMSSDFLSK